MALRDRPPTQREPNNPAPDEHAQPPDHEEETGVPEPARADYVTRFEYVVTRLLVAMMCFVIVLAVVDLAWVLIRDLLSPPFALLDIGELLDVFGLFLLVLIGIELLETLKAYVRERVVRAEVVILIAMIALARKIITLDVNDVSSATLVGIAAIVMALGLTYFLIRKTHDRDQARPPEAA